MPEPTNTHIKPTQDELDEEMKQLIEEDDKNLQKPDYTKGDEDEGDDTPEDTTPPDDTTPPADDTPEDEDEEEVEDQPKGDEPKDEDQPETPLVDKPDDKPTPDIKERYDASTREAQRLYKNVVTMDQAIADANTLPDPTEDELRGENPEWETMSDTEKKFAKEAFISRRFRAHINEAAQAIKNIKDWQDKVAEYSENPQTLIDHPEMEGKEDLFKEFASKKELSGTNFDILVTSFLYEESKKAKPNHKGEMFPRGSAGPNGPEKPNNGKITLAQAEILKSTDYKKYMEYLKADKIEDGDI